MAATTGNLGPRDFFFLFLIEVICRSGGCERCEEWPSSDTTPETSACISETTYISETS